MEGKDRSKGSSMIFVTKVKLRRITENLGEVNMKLEDRKLWGTSREYGRFDDFDTSLETEVEQL